MGMRVREQKHICGESYSTAPYLEADIFEITEAQHRATGRSLRPTQTRICPPPETSRGPTRTFPTSSSACTGTVTNAA